ncbi:MAG: hypothetical protein HUU25_14220, partial [Candidatus Sumerlaeia bacterium]|nr:hypothetical protein [Candidatus Sumerlaeia bacterium]
MSACLARSLAVAAVVFISAPSLRAETYTMVTTRGNPAGQLRVWEVTSSGDMTQVDLIAVPPVGSTARMEVDPFGRFLLSAGIDGTVTSFAVSPDGSLDLVATYARPGWTLFSRTHTLSPDGRFYVVHTRNNSVTPREWHFEALAVESDLTLTELPWKFRQDETDDTIAPNQFGICQLPSDSYGLLFTSWAGGLAHVAVMPMSASGEISSPEQWFDFNAQPIAGGFTTRVDQRIVVTGGAAPPQSLSFAISASGEAQLVDVWDTAVDGVWGASGIRLLPSGDRMVTGIHIGTAPIEASGEFNGGVLRGPSGSLVDAHPGVSPDGRIAVTTWDVDGQGIHWGVFALTPGRGPVLLRDHVLPFGYADIAFIPPRTEEMLGDANGDGLRDAADVVTYINHLADDP